MSAVPKQAPKARRQLLKWLRDPRWFFAGLLFSFSVVGRLYLGFWSDWTQAATVILSTVVLELLFGRLILREWVHPVSALMTGISLSILLTTQPGVLWPYPLAAALAIGSKYAFRHKGRHIFNPSNFAMAVIVLAVPQWGISNSAQWTNHWGPILAIAALGVIVATRARRLDAVGAFLLSFVGLAFLRSWLLALPLLWTLGPALGPEFQLFTFFMLTDPKTSPETVRGRMVYGAAIGVIDAILRVGRITYSPFYALVLVCLAVPLLNERIPWTRRQPRTEPAPVRPMTANEEGGVSV